MEKIVVLRRRSDLDEVNCYDGEIENSRQIFGDPQDSGTTGDDGDSSATPENPVGIVLGGTLTLPPGARLLCVHSPYGSESEEFVIVRLADGRLGAIDSFGSLAEITDAFFPPDVSVAKVGAFLVFLTGGKLFYSRYGEGAYRWGGEGPDGVSVDFRLRRKALPPYSYTDSEYPEFGVRVELKSVDDKAVTDWLAGRGPGVSSAVADAVVEAVRQRFGEFLKAVGSSGLYFAAVKCASVLRLADGKLWKRSPVAVVSPEEGQIKLAVTAAECTGGVLYMTLRVSRAPFTVSGDLLSLSVDRCFGPLIEDVATLYARQGADYAPDTISSPAWLDVTTRGFYVGSREPQASEAEEFPEVCADITDMGAPDRIFGIGNRLLAVYNQSDTRGANFIATSEVGMPAVASGVGKISGSPIMALCQSLRSLTSSQYGEFPLYAFCGDGIRALTPDGGSFRDVQLITRHVPLHESALTPTADATVFLSSAGVFKIEGTGVTSISKSLNDYDFTAADRLLYLYKENSLLLYRPGDTEAHLYDFNAGKWQLAEVSLDRHCYCWPKAYAEQDGMVGRLEFASFRPMERASERSGPLPVKTRAIKLGNPFALKKVSEVRAVWPDGSLQSLKLYGALKLGKWYHLGTTGHGRMLMRGSGWRFFRVESFAAAASSLPTLYFKFSEEN